MRKYLLALFLAMTIFAIQSFAQITYKEGRAYFSDKIVVKMKATKTGTLNKAAALSNLLTQKFSSFNVASTYQTFSCKSNAPENPLNNIYTVEYSASIDPEYAARKLSQSPEVEWAEPHYVYEADFIPNDPSYATQYALSKIFAAQAWDITKGDTNVVVAIVDTGVDWDHPDLINNIKINAKEAKGLPGVDDDNNGYVDDIRGWDFGGLNGTPDNNPKEDRSDHGTHVAGIAAATTNNGIGVASIGYNTKLLCVKTSRDNNRNAQGLALISYGYQGIVYAADNGAKIINCSWGGSTFSQAGQDVINYAMSKGALVVCAAGNDGKEIEHYPASYDGAVSVASTDKNDVRSSFSNYSKSITVAAPGDDIYNTWQDNTYATLDGTSMASPLVAGLAALVAVKFPGLHPLQLAEILRTSCDNIDASNPQYQYLLGGGRINAYKALSNTTPKSVRAYNVVFSDEKPGGNGNNVLEPGEEIKVTVSCQNYLSKTSSLKVMLESKDGFATIINGLYNAGSVASIDTFNNKSSRFIMKLSNNLPSNYDMQFMLKFEDGTYSGYQWLIKNANPSYRTQAANNIALTITSKGTFAFNDYPDNKFGDGFKYKNNNNVMFEGALMYGNSAAKLMDGARIVEKQSTEFLSQSSFILSTPGDKADQQGYCRFNDNNTLSTKRMNIETIFNSYSYNSAPNDNYIILHYKFVNKNDSTVNNFHAGIFYDWDFTDGSNDMAAYNTEGNFGYTYHQGGNPSFYVGSALLTTQKYQYFAIQNDGKDGGLSIYDGFDEAEKWRTISSGISKPNAGPADISMVIGAGPYSIKAKDTLEVAFVLAAGDDLNSLKNSIAQARTKVPLITTDVKEHTPVKELDFHLAQNYPNPFNPSTSISFSLKENGYTELKVYDMLGREVAVLVNSVLNKGTHQVSFNAKTLSSGMYVYQLKQGSYKDVKKMLILK